MHASISNWPVQRTQTVASNHDLPRSWPQSLFGRYRGVTQVKDRFGFVLSALIRANAFPTERHLASFTGRIH